uniref:Secreted protein n=1 Tax=Romanomermis culicivorax TaxID=13658 RepID=A0A915K3A6_ROMCU
MHPIHSFRTWYFIRALVGTVTPTSTLASGGTAQAPHRGDRYLTLKRVFPPKAQNFRKNWTILQRGVSLEISTILLASR